jgi:hypothetical protein
MTLQALRLLLAASRRQTATLLKVQALCRALAWGVTLRLSPLKRHDRYPIALRLIDLQVVRPANSGLVRSIVKAIILVQAYIERHVIELTLPTPQGFSRYVGLYCQSHLARDCFRRNAMLSFQIQTTCQNLCPRRYENGYTVRMYALEHLQSSSAVMTGIRSFSARAVTNAVISPPSLMVSGCQLIRLSV